MGGLNYFELNIFYSGLTQHSRQFRTDVRVATSSTYDFLIKFRISLVRVTVRVTEATVEVDVLDRHPTTRFASLHHGGETLLWRAQMREQKTRVGQIVASVLVTH